MHSVFLKPTIIILAIAVPVWIVVRSAFRKRTMGINTTAWKEFIYFIFYLYTVAVAAVTVVPLSYALHRKPEEWDINLVPLKNTIASIRHLTETHHGFRLGLLVQNTPGNILLFIPLGFLLPLISRKYDSFLKVFFIGLISSALIEFIQYIERSFEIYRSVDVDDVILNTTGTILGWLLFRLLYSIARIFIPK